MIIFKDIKVNEIFYYNGRRFKKKDKHTSYLLSTMEVKSFFEYSPVSPEQKTKK